MQDRVVITDFDGTFVKGDSYMLSLVFFGGWVHFIKNSHKLLFTVIEYYFNFITRNEAKRRTYQIIYTHMSTDNINRKLKKFGSRLRVFPKVRKKIESLKKEGYRVVVVTASPDIYMDYLAEKYGFDDCICTLTEKTGDILTGKLKRKNCNYAEKVVRIKESGICQSGGRIIAFGNSKGDKEMLHLADEYYIVDKKGDLTKDKMPW